MSLSREHQSMAALAGIVKNGLSQHRTNLALANDPAYWADRVDPDHLLSDEDRLARGRAQIKLNRLRGLEARRKKKEGEAR